jgi:hypothetical protein
MAHTPELEAALKAARERGKIRITELADDPDYLTAPQMSVRMGINEAELMNGVELDFVLALDLGQHGLRFPIWQLGEDNKPLPGIEELIEEFEGQQWRLVRFLMAEDRYLLKRMRNGDSAYVVGLAQGWNEGGFL